MGSLGQDSSSSATGYLIRLSCRIADCSVLLWAIAPNSLHTLILLQLGTARALYLSGWISEHPLVRPSAVCAGPCEARKCCKSTQELARDASSVCHARFVTYWHRHLYITDWSMQKTPLCSFSARTQNMMACYLVSSQICFSLRHC